MVLFSSLSTIQWFRLIFYSAPFIGSLVYARRLLMEDIRGAAEEEQLGMLRRRNLSPV